MAKQIRLHRRVVSHGSISSRGWRETANKTCESWEESEIKGVNPVAPNLLIQGEGCVGNGRHLEAEGC